MADRVRPIFKWPGGKFRLLDTVLPALPSGRRLVEPFVGSGAVFMNAAYPGFLLCDVNPDLIGFYQALESGGEDFIQRCGVLFGPDGNNAETFYRRRDRFNSLERGQARAALFLYLNRHCYNGLVRYNARGMYNVPFGRHARPYFPAREMRAYLGKFRAGGVEFLAGDFRDAFGLVREGDVVYCDPPYVPLSATANFTSYAGIAFGRADQEELAELAEKAAASGATVVVSNHDADAARELYRCASRLVETSVRRCISCIGKRREMARELVAVYDARR